MPPDCYYVYSTTTSTAQTGTPADPLSTLTVGFSRLSGKVGTLIIINPMHEMIVEILESAVVTAASNITMK